MGSGCSTTCFKKESRKKPIKFNERDKYEKIEENKKMIEKDILKREIEILKRETEKGFYDIKIENNKFINEKSNLFNSKNEEKNLVKKIK